MGRGNVRVLITPSWDPRSALSRGVHLGSFPDDEVSMLRRYWFEFDPSNQELPLDLGYGCGVTAYDLEDALKIIQSRIFGNRSLPQLSSTVEDVDVSALDEGHVRPNMASPLQRGIWFPQGHADAKL